MLCAYNGPHCVRKMRAIMPANVPDRGVMCLVANGVLCALKAAVGGYDALICALIGM